MFECEKEASVEAFFSYHRDSWYKTSLWGNVVGARIVCPLFKTIAQRGGIPCGRLMGAPTE